MIRLFCIVCKLLGSFHAAAAAAAAALFTRFGHSDQMLFSYLWSVLWINTERNAYVLRKILIEIRASSMFSWCGCRFITHPLHSAQHPTAQYARIDSARDPWKYFHLRKIIYCLCLFYEFCENVAWDIWITIHDSRLCFSLASPSVFRSLWNIRWVHVHAFRRNVRLSFRFNLNWCHTNARTAMTYTYTCALVSLSLWCADNINK